MNDSAIHWDRRRAVFLDRDGVINEKLPHDCYVKTAGQFRFLPGAKEALGILSELGFLLVVVTNQRGIARGLMTEQDLKSVHRFMLRELEKSGVTVAGVYTCPHDEFEACSCRKPEPGMIMAAIRELEIDPASSYMVGDSPSDVEAGKRAGTRTVRITEQGDNDADLVFSCLLDFAGYLKGLDGGGE